MSNELGCDLQSMQNPRAPGSHVKKPSIREEISPTMSARDTYVKFTLREERSLIPFLNTGVDGEENGVGDEGLEALSRRLQVKAKNPTGYRKE